jgi:predicted dehydrogenase
MTETLHVNGRAPEDPAPLRVALLGCGAVARLYYAPALQLLERDGVLQVGTLFDPDARALADLHALFPAATPSRSEDEITSEKAELAIVASPPRHHARQTTNCLRAGSAVLCEKPLARSVEEGESMVEAAALAGLPLACGLVRRFLPAAGFIRDALRADLIGPIRSVSCREGGSFRWPTRETSFFERGGGGVLADIGIHVLDLLAWWLGSPELLAYHDDAMGGVEANARIQLRFAGGATGEVRLSRDWAESDQYLIRGEKGWLCWQIHEPDGLRVGLHGSSRALDARVREVGAEGPGGELRALPGDFEGAFLEQLRNVASAVRGDAPLAVPGSDALVALRLVEQCYVARQLVPMPWLSEAEAAEARRLGGAV